MTTKEIFSVRDQNRKRGNDSFISFLNDSDPEINAVFANNVIVVTLNSGIDSLLPMIAEWSESKLNPVLQIDAIPLLNNNYAIRL